MSRQAWIELAVAWLPFILVISGFVFLFRRSNRVYKQHVDEVNAVNSGILAVNREMLTELRQIKQALQDRKS